MAVKKVDINNQSFEINYEILHPKNEKNLIILHGWGSNKEIMKQAFSKTFSTHRHIYIDMPGFGKSNNDYILYTNDYKNIIEEFLKAIDAKKDIIVGHSFGGKVATLLNPKLLVLLSSSGIVMPKPFSVCLKIRVFKLFKNFGGGKFYSLFASKDVSGMKQNMYETFKNVVDEDFSQSFASHNGKTLIFWGKEDTATTICTGEMISELIEDSHFYPLDGDHYFFLSSALYIEKEINGQL